MAIEIIVPRLGWSMDEGVFGEWLFRDGDQVKPGDMLFVIEGDKSAQEVESFDSGTLRIPANAPRTGDAVVVGQILGFLCGADEDAPELPPLGAIVSKSAEPKSPATSARPPEPTLEQKPQAPQAAGPAARRLARQLGVSVADVESSCISGRIHTRDIRQAISPSMKGQHPTTVLSEAAHAVPETSGKGTRIRITPRARRLAKELGIDWHGTPIRGTGAGGRIRERDVRATATTAAVPQQGAGREIAISPMRRTIAERMLAAWHQAAPVTLNTKADATELLALREGLDGAAAKPTVTDILVKCVGNVLPKHPMITGQWRDDHIFIPQACNVGFAVETEQGLVVPVLPNVSELSLHELAIHSQSLVAQARGRKLDRSSFRGGVFTVSNLGAYGVESFTPILNLPQSAILGVGCITREPVAVHDEILVAARIPLSLTFDHRVVDGAPAAAFLADLVRQIEACLSLA